MAATKKIIKPEREQQDIMDRYHPNKKVCQVPVTNIKRPDALDTLRPPPGIFLDYNLSQTEIKLDAGETKVHIQQAEGRYVRPPPGYVIELPKTPTPPKKKKFKYSSGGPPCWEFIDEIWRRNREALQKGYLIDLQNRKAARIQNEAQSFKKLHILLYNQMAGPIWYQELSPKQFATIDALKYCIMTDLKNNTIINTQENLGSLGLVLRPNHHHVHIALQHCCACPVEFLLVLYQLINPKRKNYSMNDRLILSAVVHLTMRETLKEMHIRIPSPPRIKTNNKTKKVKPEKKKNYPSPYLEPYTFQKLPRKHTGIYKNTKRQYPESPYFSYLAELKKEIKKGAELDATSKLVEEKPATNLSEKEQEILEELETAQEIYNDLAQGGPAPKLLKPSIYVSCDANPKKEEPEEVDGGEKKDVEISIKVEVTTDYDDNDDPINKTCKCTIVFEEIDDTSQENYICHYADNESDKDTQVTDNDLQDLSELKTKTLSETFDSTYMHSASNKKTEMSDVAETPEDEDAKTFAFEDIKLPHLQGKTLAVEKKDSAECTCKEEVQKIIDTSVCQCELCKEARQKKQKTTYVISDMRETEDKTERVPVIEGTKHKKTCDCLKKYLAKVKKYEAFKARYDAQRLLKSEEQKFVIGGVCRDAEGKPQYIITDIKPKKVCKCQEKLGKLQEKLDERLENMPHIPSGRLKYIISGVRETSQGSVFLVSGIVPVEDCECMKLFTKFTEHHTPCIEAFDEYMEKVRVEMDEYMQEIQNDDRFKVPVEPKIDELSENISLHTEELKENPDCPYGLKTSNDDACDNPDCPYGQKTSDDDLCDNPDCPYKQKTSDDDLCDNPDCPYKQKPSEEMCDNPDCPYKSKPSEEMCDNPDCPYKQKPSEEMCDNPDCPYKLKPSIEMCDNPLCPYKQKPSEEMCDNPDCPYKLKASVEMCDNPDCPYKQKPSEEMCDNPDCPYKPKPSEEMCDNPDCPYKPKASIEMCNNPECPYKPKPSEEMCDNPDCPYKPKPSVEICDNPDCPYNPQPSEEICDNPNCQYKQQPSAEICEKPICPYDLQPSVELCANPKCPFNPIPPICPCSEIETNLEITLEINKDEKKKKGNLSDLKRFVIMQNIPCERKAQIEIVKHVLTGLANDNYPLAKLPDVHKLPHFKLWMQLRCGKYWKMEEREKFCSLARWFWSHTDNCQRKTKFQDLPFSKHEGDKFTWANAYTVRKIVRAKKEDYYRKAKQCSIDDGKEFFPTLFVYEFPTEAFRDCFFSYIPSKEEDLYPFKVWMTHEIKDFSGRRICV